MSNIDSHSHKGLLHMDTQHFFDPETSTVSYIVYDAKTRDAVIIDPVLNYDPDLGVISMQSLNAMTEFIQKHQLIPHYCLETHAHADHLSSSQFLKIAYPGIKIAISEHIQEVQRAFRDVLYFDKSFKTNGSQFDKLIKDREFFKAGSIEIQTIPTPGHTPACLSYHIKNLVFCGDALFVEDSGTGRCDFPGGGAEALYTSIHENLYKLHDDTIVFVGHDYQPNGRELKFETTIGVSKRHNSQLNIETSKEKYVKLREDRDKTLKTPKLLFASMQVNINAGILPKFLKQPLFIREKA